MTFADATAVGPASDGIDGHFTATIADGWDIAGNANGGYLLSIAARAITTATGKPDPLTVTGHFLAPGRPGPIDVQVVVHRRGGRHCTASATLTDAGGKPLLVTLATTTDLAGASGPERVDSEPPVIPDPDDCYPVEPTDTFPPPFMGQVELRIHPDDAGFRTDTTTSRPRPSGGRPRMRGWFRLPGDQPIDTHALLLATDAFPPTIFNADLPVAWTPTVELTSHIRDLPTAGWLRCSFTTRFITGGYLEEDGEIWDTHGRLIAQSRQLALVPRAE
jgi:acyl-CoA thioesterase